MLYESKVLSEHPKVEYLKDIKYALGKVESNYYRWYEHKISSEYPQAEEIQLCHCERVFAYELYHQIRKIMESTPSPKRYEKVYLNGEAIKDDRFFINLYEGLSKVCKDFNDDKDNKRIPDLVLHKDMGGIEKEGQIYLAEIKMQGNNDALKDLFKLTCFEKSNLNFEFYIFIYVGKDVEELKQDLKMIDTTNLSKNIVCICTKYQQSTCNTLGELLE
jgi:hypothetical protein